MMMANLLRNQSRNFIKTFLSVSSKSGYHPTNKNNFHTTLQLEKIVSFNLSDIGEGIREVTVKEWFINVGDVVEQFDNLCEVQSDKASVTITSRYDGKVVKLHKDVDDIALVGKPLLDFDVADDEEEAGSSQEDSSSDEEVEEVVEAVAGGGGSFKMKPLATPAVRRLAMENKIDLSKVNASGRNRRVLKGDILEYLNIIPKGTVKPHPTLAHQNKINVSKTAVKEPKIIEINSGNQETIVPLKGIAKAMYRTMTESLKIPHFAYCDEIDLSNLVKIRQDLKKEALNKGVKLTYMPFFIKAASFALKEFPILNSSFDEPNESVIYKSYHNISIAMHTPQGLVVPNVKNVENKTLLEIAAELNTLQERGNSGTLAPEDFANGTFSISNIGMVGGTYTHPCIMTPQVAIGAVGQTRVLPRFDEDGSVVKAHIMNVSWCADHRIIDGVTMASFSNLWKKYLEHPSYLLLFTK